MTDSAAEKENHNRRTAYKPQWGNALRKDKLRIEREHAQRICDDSEAVWGWGSAAGQCRVKRRIKCFLDFIEDIGDPTVLEIGGGTGIFSRHIMKHNIKLVAVDISPAFIRRSRETTGDKVHYVLGDAENLPFEDGSFNAIFAISVLHHLDIEKTLKEAARLLRKGGKIFFTEPNMLNPQVFFIKNVDFIKHRYYWVPHETAFFRWRLKRTLERAGFYEISVKNFDFVHPAIPKRFVSLWDRVGKHLEKMPLIKEISGSLLITASNDRQ